ncbi:hypothetical protein, partial [Gordonia sp. (in: high G+C Gram-positive bacteria)]|uniref:hypothetical protein n=1 Tax=Gordonia sp. (in: high G+C Gram-positive bacteria) TaxID=84139 RepID=UPI0039E62225
SGGTGSTISHVATKNEQTTDTSTPAEQTGGKKVAKADKSKEGVGEEGSGSDEGNPLDQVSLAAQAASQVTAGQQAAQAPMGAAQAVAGALGGLGGGAAGGSSTKRDSASDGASYGAGPAAGGAGKPKSGDDKDDDEKRKDEDSGHQTDEGLDDDRKSA